MPEPHEVPDLPPYTYVTGHPPHPISDPHGHMQNASRPETWSCRDYARWGKRLFDHGFYWESHEAWEHVWLELGRTSGEAMLVKGLIKLAASAVKCREGNASGAIRHATRAAELLQGSGDSMLFDDGLLTAACEAAQRVAKSPPIDHVPPSSRPVPLPGFET